MGETVVAWHCSKSVRALIARVKFMAIFLPTHMIAHQASLSRLHFCRATPNLPTLAQLLAVHKNLAVIRYCDACARLAFSL